MICNSLRTVVYCVGLRRATASCTSRTVEGPRSQRTVRISSSPSVGRGGSGIFAGILRRSYYEELRLSSGNKWPRMNVDERGLKTKHFYSSNPCSSAAKKPLRKSARNPSAQPGNAPSGPVRAPDKPGGLGRIVELQLGRIPNEVLLREPGPHRTEQHAFRQRAGVIEGRRRLAFPRHGIDELEVMVVHRLPGNLEGLELIFGQQNGHRGVRQQYRSLGSDEDRAFERQSPGPGQRLHLFRRALVAVGPRNRHRLALGVLGAGKNIMDHGIGRPTVLAGLRPFRLQRQRGGQFESREWRIVNVATHVAEGGGPEIDPLDHLATAQR